MARTSFDLTSGLTRRAILLGAASSLVACAPRSFLVDAPVVNTGAGFFPSDTVRRAERAATATLFFVTDRKRQPGGGFGAERDQKVTFGDAKVKIGGPRTTWQDIVAQSNGERLSLPLQMSDISELGHLPATPVPFTLRNGRPADIPQLTGAYMQAEQSMQSALADRLRTRGTGDVLLHIPGVSTDFADGAFSLIDLWHHAGRRMMPIIYSWPSGSGGLLGYFTDRESGEFTIFHLKEFLRQLAETPGVQRIHIVAHSRGTAIATSALREMIIGQRASGIDPRRALKIENLIFAAPDLSFDVVAQRVVAERLGPAVGRITAYTSLGDSALAFAQRIMSGTRFGRIGPEQIPLNVQQVFQEVKNVNFIRVERGGGQFGHSYFRENPRVLSDIVLLLRTCAAPGTPARPMEPIGGNFWQIPTDYLENGNPIEGSCVSE